MARSKIDYGIDLGTTNSAIARMENGDPIIKKSEGYQKDTTPSCIHFNKKKTLFTGDKAYKILDKESILSFKKNDPTLLNTYIEFKRTMGSAEKYECNNMNKSFSSEELSAEVLKALKGYVRDEEINSIVITVPAKFQSDQDDATMKASELAGFQHCILLQEPIAASMAYGVDAQTIDGEWLVFDFGGGTFDAALMKADEGIMKVVDTEGSNTLGGKNIDYAIIDEIIMPYLTENFSIDNILSNEERKRLLRNAVKRLAEETKINLSLKDNNRYEILVDEPIGEDDEGNQIDIDLTVTKEQYEDIVKPIFQQAIDLSKKLLNNNKLTGSELKTVLMIGGPTFSHTLREMIRKQITNKIDISIDPMIAVAKGAALFASTKDIPEGIKKIDKSKIQLKLTYSTDTVETKEKVGIRVLREKIEGDYPENLFVDLIRQDKGWSSGKSELKGDAEIIDIDLAPGKSNGFSIIITDDKGNVFPSEPESFSIIQGFKVPGATLSFDHCIDVFDTTAGKQQLTTIKGLKKNQPLPAKGIEIYKTQSDIRPGKKSDRIRIPVYQGEASTRAIYNLLLGEVFITGEQLSGMLPKGSEVELTIEIDESRMIKVSACFPYLDDEIVENVIKKKKRESVSKEFLETELQKGHNSVENLEEDYSEMDSVKLEEVRNGLNELDNLLEKGGSDSNTRSEILDRMRAHLKILDELEAAGEWPKVMQELTEALEYLESNDERFGNEKTAKMVSQINVQVKVVIENQDMKTAKRLTEQISSFSFAIVDQGAGVALEISMIKGFDDDFDMHDWKNKTDARKLINDAKNIINSNRPTKDNLRPIVNQLYQLLPGPQQGIGGQPDEDLLIK